LPTLIRNGAGAILTWPPTPTPHAAHGAIGAARAGPPSTPGSHPHFHTTRLASQVVGGSLASQTGPTRHCERGAFALWWFCKGNFLSLPVPLQGLRWKVLTPDAQINISKSMVEATPTFQNISNQKLSYSKLRWLRQLRHFKA